MKVTRYLRLTRNYARPAPRYATRVPEISARYVSALRLALGVALIVAYAIVALLNA